jgi:hypothetical protein
LPKSKDVERQGDYRMAPNVVLASLTKEDDCSVIPKVRLEVFSRVVQLGGREDTENNTTSIAPYNIT